MTVAQVSLADIQTGLRREAVVFRLLHFWEARRPTQQNILMGLEMLLIDEQFHHYHVVERALHDEAPTTNEVCSKFKFCLTNITDSEQFTDEIQRAGELKHKRLVKFIGFCIKEDERLLVAEFLPNDTLAKRLFINQKDETMDRSMRLRVAYHIAEALEYSSSAGFEAYHNLSAYSVLFDTDGEVCVSCFGLIRARSYDRTTQIIRGIVNPKKVTYRFGIFLLNLLTGMQITPSHAPEMINGKDVTELMDPNLEGKFSIEEATIVLKLASNCLECIDSKSLITKELVSTLETLLTKTKIPTNEMAKPQEEGASSSQQH